MPKIPKKWIDTRIGNVTVYRVGFVRDGKKRIVVTKYWRTSQHGYCYYAKDASVIKYLFECGDLVRCNHD